VLLSNQYTLVNLDNFKTTLSKETPTQSNSESPDLNCNCCLKFAYHHVVAQITLSHFVSIIFCFTMKKSSPCTPSCQG
jgi:hypothetical protein